MNPSNERPLLRHLTPYIASPPSLHPTRSIPPSLSLCHCPSARPFLPLSYYFAVSLSLLPSPSFGSPVHISDAAFLFVNSLSAYAPLSVFPSIRLYILPSACPLPSVRMPVHVSLHPNFPPPIYPSFFYRPSVPSRSTLRPSVSPLRSPPFSSIARCLPCQSAGLFVPSVLQFHSFLHLPLSAPPLPEVHSHLPRSLPSSLLFACVPPTRPSLPSSVRPPIVPAKRNHKTEAVIFWSFASDVDYRTASVVGGGRPCPTTRPLRLPPSTRPLLWSSIPRSSAPLGSESGRS